MQGRGREDTVVKFTGIPGTCIENLEYRSEVLASLTSLTLLHPFTGKPSFYCAITGTHCVHVASSVA